MFGKIEILPIDVNVHNSPLYFKEQLAVLYFGGFTDDGQSVKLIRSYVQTGQTSLTSFDPDGTGVNSSESWRILDDFIENRGVWGTFHTHPGGAYYFSGTDLKSYRGIAVTYGERFIYHGVQCQTSLFPTFLCFHMAHKKIECYEIGQINVRVEDPIVILPSPSELRHGNRIQKTTVAC